MIQEIFTIGHSQHSIERFVELLRKHDVTAVADVRSQPHSRQFPHFTREPLEASLKTGGVSYVFLGRELGGRTTDESCYVDGKLDYERLSGTGEFKGGIDRLYRGMRRFNIAMMCTEKDPLNCHRCILIGRWFHERQVTVKHILDNGDLEHHEQSVKRLLDLLKLSGPHMFRDEHGVLSLAYQLQGEKIAFSIQPTSVGSSGIMGNRT